MNVISFVTDNWETIFAVTTQVVGVFAIIATATPNKSDDKIVDVVLGVINTLGGNFGKSGNK